MRASCVIVADGVRGSSAEGEAPGWRDEMRTRNAVRWIAKRSGGSSSTGSPLTAARTGAAAETSSADVVHHWLG
jgi:hypothetical protein